MLIELSFQTNDGLTLRGFTLLPKGNPKAVIALIHGMGEHSQRYNHVAQFFEKQRIVTMGIDLRGHGKSEGKRGHTPDYATLMNDIYRFLDKVKREFHFISLANNAHFF